MKKYSSFFIAILLIFTHIITALAEEYKVPCILMNFSVDDRDNWEQTAATKENAFIRGEFSEAGYAGGAIKFTFDAAGWGCMTERKTLLLNDWQGYTGVSFWIKGSSGQEMSFRFSETGSSNDVWTYRFVISKNNQWENHTIPFTEFTTASSTNGDGILDLTNVVKYGFQPVSKTSGQFYADEIMLTSPKEGIVISDLRANTIGSVYYKSPISLNLDISNFYSKLMNQTVNYTVKNADGEVVLQGKKTDCIVEESGHLSATLDLDIEKYGYFTVEASLDGVSNSERGTEFSYFKETSPLIMNKSKNRLGFSAHYDHIKDFATIKDEIELIASSGSNFIRQDIVWDDVEPVKGVYDWSRYDYVVELCKNLGIELEYTVCYAAPWNTTAPPETTASQLTHYAPVNADDYGKFVYECVNRYKHYVKNWELWNEPNIPAFWKPAPNAEAYSQILRAGYLYGKKADPTSIIGSGGMSGTGRDFFRQLINLGMKDYMDVFIIHPYQSSDPERTKNLENELRNVRNFAPEKDFWVTEWGWNITRSASLVQQAEWTAKGYVIKTSMGINKAGLYSFNILTDNGYGINSSARGGITRPVFPAIAAQFRVLGERDYVGNADTEDGVRIYCYTAPNKAPVLVMWSETEKEVTLPVSGNVTLYDLYGNPEALTVSDNKVTFKVTDRPIYVEGGFFTIASGAKPLYQTKSSEPTPKFELWQSKPDYYETESYIITKGYQKEFAVTVYNYSNEEQKGVLKVEGLPNEWFTTQSGSYISYSIPPYSSKVVGTTLTPPVDTPLGDYTATVFDIGAKNRLKAKEYKVSLASEIGINLNKRQISFRNGTDITINGNFVFNDTDDWKFTPKSNSFVLETAKSDSIEYKIAPKHNKVQNGIINVTGNVSVIGAVGKVDFSQSLFAYAAPRVEAAIEIDGNLSEWDDVSPIMFDNIGMSRGFGDAGDATKAWSLENLSGNVKIKWDSKNIYIAAEVVDNVHCQEFSDSGLWNGDSMQIGFDTRCDGTNSFNNGVYEITIGKPNNGDPQVYKGYGSTAKELIKGSKFAFIRDDEKKTSIYEVSIPLTELDGMSKKTDGSEIGLSFILNDNDAQGRVGYMEWAAGVGGSKDARLFGSLWFK